MLGSARTLKGKLSKEGLSTYLLSWAPLYLGEGLHAAVTPKVAPPVRPFNQPLLLASIHMTGSGTKT